MASGVVKWFDSKKGYGFITSDSSEDVFFHYSVIDMGGYKTVVEGQRVEFEPKKTDKGIQAARVAVLGDPGEAAE